MWFEFWIENIVGDLAPNTLRNYRERYKQNIQPIIGTMLLSDVKPLSLIHISYPFILLDLVLSCVSAIQALLIMMSQNRQEEKDRRRAERCV